MKSAQFDYKAELVKKLDRFNDPRIVTALLDLSMETGVTALYADLDKRINRQYNYGMYMTAQAEIKSKEDKLQNEIRNTLKKIAPNVKESLIAVLQGDNNTQRKIASEVLESIGWKASSPDLEMKQWVVNNQWEKFDTAGNNAFDFLVGMLNDSYVDNPGYAAKALAKLHDHRAVGPMIAAMKGKISGWSMLSIMESLAELDAVESIDPMMVKLGQLIELHDTNQVRYSKEVIEKCLLHFQVRAVAPLTQLINGNVDLNLFIIEILGKIGDPQAIPALLKQFEKDDLVIQENAAKSLKKIGWQATQDDNGAKYHCFNENWPQCVEAGEAAVPTLLSIFQNKYSLLYRGAAMALKGLYQSGKLSPESTAAIFKLNGAQIESHNDGESLSTCTHTDEPGTFLEL